LRVKIESWNGNPSFSSLEKLLCGRIEFKFWIVTEIHWKREKNSGLPIVSRDRCYLVAQL